LRALSATIALYTAAGSRVSRCRRTYRQQGVAVHARLQGVPHMPRTGLFAIFAVLLGAGLAHATDKDKLRQAVRLPGVSALFGIGFNTENGAMLSGEQRVTPPPEDVLKSLTGKSSDAAIYEQLADSYGSRGQKDKARAAQEKAVALYRQRLREQPAS